MIVPISITLIIIALNVVVSIAAFNNRNFFWKAELSPYNIHHNNQWYRFMSHAFLHANWPHLIINMYVFHVFGKLVELGFAPLFGTSYFILYPLLYLGGILFAALPSYGKHKNNPSYSAVGASGAVSAIVFSAILMNPTMPLGIILIPGFRLPAVVFGLLYLGYEYYMDKKGSNDNIAHDAHFWGALFGIAFTLVLEPSVGMRFINQIIDLLS